MEITNNAPPERKRFLPFLVLFLAIGLVLGIWLFKPDGGTPTGAGNNATVLSQNCQGATFHWAMLGPGALIVNGVNVGEKPASGSHRVEFASPGQTITVGLDISSPRDNVPEATATATQEGSCFEQGTTTTICEDCTPVTQVTVPETTTTLPGVTTTTPTEVTTTTAPTEVTVTVVEEPTTTSPEQVSENPPSVVVDEPAPAVAPTPAPTTPVLLPSTR